MIERLKASPAGRVAQKFLDDHAPNWAVQIAWSALLAMFPIILIAVAVLGVVTGMTGLGGEDVRRRVAAVFPDADAQRQVQEALRNVKQQSGLFAVVGFAGLFLSGSALFGAMDQAFAEVYQARPRSLVSQRLMSIGMILLFTALIGLAVLSSSLLPALKNLGGIIPWSLTSGPLAFILQAVGGVLAGFILYATIYYVVPNRRQRWSQVLPGALVAGVLLELVTLLFPVYLSLTRGMAAYGKTFGLLFVLMTFRSPGAPGGAGRGGAAGAGHAALPGLPLPQPRHGRLRQDLRPALRADDLQISRCPRGRWSRGCCWSWSRCSSRSTSPSTAAWPPTARPSACSSC